MVTLKGEIIAEIYKVQFMQELDKVFFNVDRTEQTIEARKNHSDQKSWDSEEWITASKKLPLNKLVGPKDYYLQDCIVEAN